jgi:hypothetical protein
MKTLKAFVGEMAADLNVSASCIRSRLDRGWRPHGVSFRRKNKRVIYVHFAAHPHSEHGEPATQPRRSSLT